MNEHAVTSFSLKTYSADEGNMHRNVVCCTKVAAVAVAACLLLTSCVARRYAPTRGTIDDDGVRITAVDGSFTFQSGEVFQPPSYVEQSGGSFRGNCWQESTSHPEDWRGYLDSGAQLVKVEHPAYRGTLYGVLAFCSFLANKEVPAARSYLIRIDPRYVKATANGTVSVVYEQYEFTSGTWGLAWILFLSRDPFQ